MHRRQPEASEVNLHATRVVDGEKLLEVGGAQSSRLLAHSLPWDAMRLPHFFLCIEDAFLTNIDRHDDATPND